MRHHIILLDLLVMHINILCTSTAVIPVSMYSNPLIPGQPSAEFLARVVQAVKDVAHSKSDFGLGIHIYLTFSVYNLCSCYI